ncbi:hypothetical protein tb265_18690 [Gemmatimonadetes bacterium T265]|nr:hypothetical protein tb265_18690 [Gemmatimonadetes bacterium T265]
MTDHTADHFPPGPPSDDVTAEQLASEPALALLGALRLTAADEDALARRIEAAAAAELARRREGTVHRPRLVVTSVPRRSAVRDLAPLIARALRPAMLAAAAAAVFAVGLSEWSGTTEPTGQQVSDASAVQALNLHDPSAQWPDQASAPTVDALGRAIGLGGAP